MQIYRSSFDKNRLQIPQSYVKTYFTEKDTHEGEWDLKVPEKPEIRKSYNHRWPIGFVTSGCVYGRYVAACFVTSFSL